MKKAMARSILVVVMLLAFAVIAEAQQAKKVPRIGVLRSVTLTPTAQLIGEAFVQGLRDLGWVDRQNVAIEYRYAKGNVKRLPDLAAELVGLNVNVFFAGDRSGRRLELLKEVIPRLSRLGVLWNPNNPGQPTALKDTHVAAEALKVTLISMEARNREELERVLSSIGKERLQALLEVADPLTFFNRGLITETAAKHKLPAMYSFGEWVDAGGLMSYGTSFPDLFRRAATYVDKILKGAKPAELPVEQPIKFELVINLKAAKQIGVTVPQNMLARADKVIK